MAGTDFKHMKEIKKYGKLTGESDLLDGIRPERGMQETWNEYMPAAEDFSVFYIEFCAWKEGYLQGNPQ